MPLEPGSRLGPYEIASPLGAGGMGEVYRARDTRLGRDVAVKILPADFANDPGRRQRFEQEARAVAALNHPNIVALYDVGDGYLVSELVDGESLRAIKPGAKKAADIAAQIASGLAAAHEAGIVHRDLKPDNVLLTRDGRIKILDFGLAKLTHAPATGGTQTVTVRTQPGTVMGTVGYMSPEQVRGLEADHRSDIFSLGLVLYEMLAGRRAFDGDTSVEIMTAILKQEAPELPETVPAGLWQIVAHCLEKEPGQRFQSAKDLAFALAQGLSQSGAAPAIDHPAVPRRRALLAAAAIAIAALGLAAGLLLRRGPAENRWTGVMLGGTAVSTFPRISPDGQTVAFTAWVEGTNQVAIMTPGNGDVATLTHSTENGYVQEVAWSRDGTAIYYDRFTDVPRGIYRVSKLGGPEQLVLEEAALPDPLPDGSLLLERYNAEHRAQVFRYWPDTGKLQPLPVIAPGGFSFSSPRSLPDGRSAVLYGRALGPAAETGEALYLLQLDSGTLRRLPLNNVEMAGFTLTPDGRSVLAGFHTGGGTRIVSIPLDGRGAARDVLTLTSVTSGIDQAADGSLYLDQWQRPAALMRFSASGGHAEKLAGFPSAEVDAENFALLDDGRAVVSQIVAGLSRLVAIEPGKAPVPLLPNTREETAMPVTVAGPGEVAFLIGAESRRAIAVASVGKGQITRRVPFGHGAVEALAATRDGKTLFCAAEDMVWAIGPSGDVRKLRRGNRVAVDPDGKYLLVESIETPAIRFFRVPLDGGPEQEIPRTGPGRAAAYITPNSVGRGGRIVTPLGSSVWNWPAGVLDPTTGLYTKIPIDSDLDFHSMAWTPDGRILALGLDMQSTLWKFTLEAR